MKNKIIFSLCIFILCIVSNLYTPLFSQFHLNNLLHYPGEGTSTKWLSIIDNHTTYYVEMFCYSKTPYAGRVYTDTNQSPINKVTYWDVNNLMQSHIELLSESWSPLAYVSIENDTIFIKDPEMVTMYIVNLLTGDTVFTHNFPQPITEIKTGPFYKPKSEWTELDKITLKRYGADSTGIISQPVSTETLTVNYSLPTGTYVAYFINTNDGKFRWAQDITKP